MDLTLSDEQLALRSGVRDYLADRWNADLFDALTGPGFRVPKPVRAATGDWIAHGWTAWRLVSGVAADWSGVSPRWPELSVL